MTWSASAWPLGQRLIGDGHVVEDSAEPQGLPGDRAGEPMWRPIGDRRKAERSAKPGGLALCAAAGNASAQAWHASKLQGLHPRSTVPSATSVPQMSHLKPGMAVAWSFMALPHLGHGLAAGSAICPGAGRPSEHSMQASKLQILHPRSTAPLS